MDKYFSERSVDDLGNCQIWWIIIMKKTKKQIEIEKRLKAVEDTKGIWKDIDKETLKELEKDIRE